MPVIGGSAFSSAGDCFSLVRGLLNDADIPSISTITPVGAVRSGNLVTITTALPHLLGVDNKVQVANVTDSSFSGSQVVFSIPTPTTFTYNQAGTNATSGNGTVSLLIQGDVWTDTVLIPLANKAYRKVQRRLAEAGSKSTTEEVIVTLAVGATDFSDTSSPQLPTDFLAPRQMWERISGTTDFSEMSPVDVLPVYSSQPSYNRFFAWFNEGISFVGASNRLDVRLRYMNGLTPLSDGTSAILIRGGIDAVASQTAFLAAVSRGSPSATMFSAQFEEDMKELLNLQAHARQYVVGRRRPNNARRGRCASF